MIIYIGLYYFVHEVSALKFYVYTIDIDIENIHTQLLFKKSVSFSLKLHSLFVFAQHFMEVLKRITNNI